LAGARAMGLEQHIGSLEPGKQADIIAIDLDRIEAAPVYDVVSQLVYAGARHWVGDVWIAGRAKMLKRELQDMDRERILSTARRWQTTIREIPRP